MSRIIKIAQPLLLAAILVVGILFGFMLRDRTEGKPFWNIREGYEDTEKFNHVFSIIKDNYVDELNEEQMTDAAVSEMLNSLDPHSMFLSKEYFKAEQERLKGQYKGVGIEFVVVKDTVLVVAAAPGGPSDKVGIRAGDKIIKVEEETVAGVNFSQEDLVKLLRGEMGTEVGVSIKRFGVDSLLSFTIQRDEIAVHSVAASYMVTDKIGYIKLIGFTHTTIDEFNKHLRELKEQGMEQLVLDLRNNGGGLLNAAVAVADHFLRADQLVIYTEGRTETRQDYTATADGNFEKGDLVILINQNSASASEIVAGAIQDWDRGIIIGRRSFGKGLVGEQYPLKDGTALRLTVARYYTPSGRSIQKPYNNGNEEYQNEVFERIESGEFESLEGLTFPDSLKYKTKLKGRTVYGGGAIIPDLFVPIDTIELVKDFNRLRGYYIPSFAYEYYANNLSEFEQYTDLEDFNNRCEVPDTLYDEFLSFIRQDSINFNEFRALQFRDRISQTIKAYFAKERWGDTGLHNVLNVNDPTFAKALDYLMEENNLSVSP